MNKFPLGVLFLIVFSTSLAQRVARFYDDDVERGNKFIDDLLRDMMYERGSDYDPYHLEESALGFSKKVLFVNVSGEAKLHNGYIIGLSTLHRPDYCVVRQEGDKLHVTADLGAGIIKCHYDGTVKFMNFGPTISIYGEVIYLEVHMEFSVDSNTGRNGVLNKFYIDDMKGMKVEITGLGPMNWAANYLISGITKLFKGFIKRMMENQVKNHIAERLPKYVFPVDAITTSPPETEAPITEVPETIRLRSKETIEKEELIADFD